MSRDPAPRGARPRPDIRPRVLASLASEPATITEIAERAGLPGRDRTFQATRALARLEADGLAVRTGPKRAPRWRLAAAASIASQGSSDHEA